MKPEIAAPGVDVAAGTAMGDVVDARYASASGTSMATPHVAGAAAALLGEHPDWSAARLKAALVTTAAGVPGTVYQVGGGRLDIGAAATAKVIGDRSSVDFGAVSHGATEPLTEKLSWTNTGPAPVTLRLAAAFDDAAGALSLPSTVIVPAAGSAGVTLCSTRAPQDGRPLQRRRHRQGGRRVPADPGRRVRPDGVTKIQVPEGHYAVFGTVADTTAGKERSAFAGDAELAVTRDTTLPLDASRARPVRVTAPGMTDGHPGPADRADRRRRRLRQRPVRLRRFTGDLQHGGRGRAHRHVPLLRRRPPRRRREDGLRRAARSRPEPPRDRGLRRRPDGLRPGRRAVRRDRRRHGGGRLQALRGQPRRVPGERGERRRPGGLDADRPRHRGAGSAVAGRGVPAEPGRGELGHPAADQEVRRGHHADRGVGAPAVRPGRTRPPRRRRASARRARPPAGAATSTSSWSTCRTCRTARTA